MPHDDEPGGAPTGPGGSDGPDEDRHDEEPHDDLTRLLGYRGAVDPAEECDEVAPEIVRTPCWTPSFCDLVVRAAEATGAFEPHPDDPVPGHEVSLMTISPALYGALQDDLGHRIWPRLRQRWPLIEYRGLRDAFVIRYSAETQTELRLHQDVAQVSGSIALGDRHEGAALHFPRQGYRNDSQPVGSLLAWPSLVTHPHEVTPLRSGVKHSLTLWFELPLDLG